MTAPKECFSYLEDNDLPGEGLGHCLQTVVPVKEKEITVMVTRKCSDVIDERKCPRKHMSPYLKEGERS